MSLWHPAAMGKKKPIGYETNPKTGLPNWDKPVFHKASGAFTKALEQTASQTRETPNQRKRRRRK